MSEADLIGRCVVPGDARGDTLHADVGLSFWGGVDPGTGRVIDRHHPLCGEIIAGRVLAIPSGRGSCSGSTVLLELLVNGRAPAALVFERDEWILPLGVVIAEEMFGRSIPVVSLEPEAFRRLAHMPRVRVADGRLSQVDADPASDEASPEHPVAQPDVAAVTLSDADRAMLEGQGGRAAAIALRIVLRMAAIAGADRLIDVTQAHIDGCIYTGPAGLAFARLFEQWGGRVRIPTSLNAISVDRRHWRRQGVAASTGEPASELADCYVALGAAPTFTCAPYLLDTAPGFGAQIAWSESNAVAFANSVLGARTMKYPDFLDLCVALTGRAPDAGCHRTEPRRARVEIDVVPPEGVDDAFWACLGHHVGTLVPDAVPVVTGLAGSRPSRDDLKAFGAAFATTSGAPMFHIVGITPEAPTATAALGNKAPERQIRVTDADLRACWAELNTAGDPTVDVIAFGNPHVSLDECRRLAGLCLGTIKHPAVTVIVTCGRAVHAQAEAEGLVETLQAFGMRFVTDTCWCMIGEPLIPPAARTLMTNSAKYAHYAPGLVGRTVHFAGTAACVEAAVSGRCEGRAPAWLAG